MSTRELRRRPQLDEAHADGPAWLGKKVARCELLFDSELTRDSELELMQIAKRVAEFARHAGITIKTSSIRLQRLLDNFNND